jgi:hypothetical protein
MVEVVGRWVVGTVYFECISGFYDDAPMVDGRVVELEELDGEE